MQTARIDIAQRIGREIAEQPLGPMHVLQHAVRRLIDSKAEIAGKAVVPSGLEVAHQQIAGYQRLL